MFDLAQYQSPEWQKKRLEVMEAAGWKCQCCGIETKQLHVHHRGYLQGKKLWEYGDSYFRCLCVSCHGTLHSSIDAVRSSISMLEKKGIDDFAHIAFVLNQIPPPWGESLLSVLRQTADWAMQSFNYEMHECNGEDK